MKKVIYTCITGGYDEVPIHKYVAQDWDYILFTDNSDLISQGYIAHWIVKPLKFNKLTNVKNARWHKINTHKLFPKYDYSLWLDANIIVNSKKFIDLFDKLITEKCLIASPNHPKRKCIYQEAEVIKELNIDIPKTVDAEMQVLKKHKYPKDNGLTETNILFRNHNKIKPMLNLWWNMLEEYSKRDQLSFNYSLWVNNIDIMQIYTNKEGFGIHRLANELTFTHSKNHDHCK